MVMMVVVDVMMVTVTLEVGRMRGDGRMDWSAYSNGRCCCDLGGGQGREGGGVGGDGAGAWCSRFISGIRSGTVLVMMAKVASSDHQRRRSDHHRVHLFRRPNTQRRQPFARTTLGRSRRWRSKCFE